jgi:hypothetical protein
MGRTIRHVAPEPFCDCKKLEHDCRKEIQEDRLMGAWESFMGEFPP